VRKIDQRTQRVIPKRADGTTFTYTEALAVPVEKAGGRQESWSEQPSSSVSESGDLISAIRARHAEDDDQARNGAPPWVRWSTALSQKAVEIPFHFLELLVGLVQALVFTLLTAVFTLLVKTDFIDRMTEAVPVLSVIMLCGCEGLTVRDTSSLLVPGFNGLKFLASWQALERPLPPFQTWSACSSGGHEPYDGGNHGRFSNCLDLLRAIDCVATRDRLEQAYLRFARCERNQALP